MSTAAERGLNHRFSLILKHYAWDECGKSFDQVIFFDLLELVLGWIGCESLAITTRDTRTFGFGSVRELAEHYSRLPAESGEPFAYAEARVGETVRCLVETEFWNQVGGPMPYSDEYVFAFYVSTYDRSQLQKMIVRRCVELDVPISELRQGCISPQFEGHRRIRRALRKWF